MRNREQILTQFGRIATLVARVPMAAAGQHLFRFGVWMAAALLLLGWVSPTFDWDEDASWELQSEGVRYRLDQTLSDLGVADSAEEMVILPSGLLVRHRERRAVNLTVLKGNWSVLRSDKLVGTVGDSLENWRSQVGEPRKMYVNPQKVGVIYYYRASLLDLGLMVAEGKVLSVMFVEPGYLEQALQRSGYQPES